MSHKFKVGDKARVKFATTKHGEPFVGQTVTVISPCKQYINNAGEDRYGHCTDARSPISGGMVYFRPDQLEPITDEKPKRREIDAVVPWSDMPWKPVEVQA